MFDVNDIISRLQAGEDFQTIADEAAEALNKANKIVLEQKAHEADAKRVENQKIADLQEIINLFGAWLHEHYDVSEKIMSELHAKEVIEVIDSMKSYVAAIKNIEDMFGTSSLAPSKTTIKTNSADDTLNAFLNKMGW